MSAGSYPAGLGPTGVAPIDTSAQPPRPRQPKALRYEGATADWALDTLGNYKAVTPVEQGIALSLCVRQGSIKSSPTTGNTLHEIVYLGAPDLANDIRNRIMSANPLARLVSEKQAEIVRIDHEIRKQGFVAVVYFRDMTSDKNRVLQQDASIVSR
jgi:hypothetical protein